MSRWPPHGPETRGSDRSQPAPCPPWVVGTRPRASLLYSPIWAATAASLHRVSAGVSNVTFQSEPLSPSCLPPKLPLLLVDSLPVSLGTGLAPLSRSAPSCMPSPIPAALALTLRCILASFSEQNCVGRLSRLNCSAAPRCPWHGVQPSRPPLFLKSQTQSRLRAFALAVPLPGHLPSDGHDSSSFHRFSDISSFDDLPSPLWIKPYSAHPPHHPETLCRCLETGLELVRERAKGTERAGGRAGLL